MTYQNKKEDFIYENLLNRFRSIIAIVMNPKTKIKIENKYRSNLFFLFKQELSNIYFPQQLGAETPSKNSSEPIGENTPSYYSKLLLMAKVNPFKKLNLKATHKSS